MTTLTNEQREQNLWAAKVVYPDNDMRYEGGVLMVDLEPPERRGMYTILGREFNIFNRESSALYRVGEKLGISVAPFHTSDDQVWVAESHDTGHACYDKDLFDALLACVLAVMEGEK